MIRRILRPVDSFKSRVGGKKALSNSEKKFSSEGKDFPHFAITEIDAELLIGLAVVKNFGTLQSSLRAK